MKNTTYKQNTATLAEVAQKAGVSRQTAGRILGNAAQKHKPSTVEKVQAAADELGYRPNLLAKSVVAGRTFSIGVLLPEVNHDAFFAQVVCGIQEALSETPFVPIFLHTSARQPERTQIHRLVDRRVDGILLIPQINKVDPDYFNEISNRNIPVVCINAQLSDIEPVDFVGTDEFAGGKAAAEYLLARGHTRLCSVCYGGVSENLSTRHNGFKQTVEAAGRSCSSLNLPGWTLEENLAALLDYLQQTDRPTAFFCITDLYAAMLYKAAEKLGLSIPNDLSVIGFADLLLSSYLNPSLTTQHQDGSEIGRIATALLMERIDGFTGAAREIRIQAQLIERESVYP